MKVRLGVETRKSYVILRLCMLVIPQKETYSSYKCKCTATLFFAGLLGVTNGMRPQNFSKNKFACFLTLKICHLQLEMGISSAKGRMFLTMNM